MTIIDQLKEVLAAVGWGALIGLAIVGLTWMLWRRRRRHRMVRGGQRPPRGNMRSYGGSTLNERPDRPMPPYKERNDRWSDPT